MESGICYGYVWFDSRTLDKLTLKTGDSNMAENEKKNEKTLFCRST